MSRQEIAMAKLDPKKLAALVKKNGTPAIVKTKAPKINVDAIRSQIEDGDGDEEIMDLVDDYDPEEDGNPPSWIDPDDEPTWEKAKEAAGGEDESKAKDYWAVVTHIFKWLGGTVKGKG
jgi:hypothetical protein